MVAADIAAEAMQVLARATSTSEVLTLNLTNLLILVGLKALIFVFGFVFAGSAASTARSADAGVSLTDSEMSGGMCFLLYTSGEHDKLACIQKEACVDTDTADSYYTAGKMWYQMHKTLGLPFPEKYEKILNGVSDAVEYSKMGGDCSAYQW